MRRDESGMSYEETLPRMLRRSTPHRSQVDMRPLPYQRACAVREGLPELLRVQWWPAVGVLPGAGNGAANRMDV